MSPIKETVWRRFLASMGYHDTRAYLSGLFGKPPDRDLSEDTLSAIKRGASFLYGPWTDGVDDKTWSDLNMDAVYMRVNQAQSQAGEQSLYAMLRKTNIQADELQRRARRVDWAMRDAEERENLKRRLYHIGSPRRVDLPAMFGECRHDVKKMRLHAAMSGLLLACVVLLFIQLPFAPALLVLSLVANIYTAARDHARNAGYIESMSYLVNVLGFARVIAARREPAFQDLALRLEDPLKRLRKLDNGFIQMHNTLSNAPVTEAFMMLIGFLFLLESILFQDMLRMLERERPAMLQALRAVGEVDACICIASYRQSLSSYCEPDLRAQPEPMLRIADAVHPLLANGRPNSIDAAKSILITGSNATGKSTFLRTVAVNAILAQTLYTCTARAWTSSFFRIETSMAARDDLEGGESLFVSEMRSLKRMIDHVDPERPGLLIIDEALRGTNTHERIAAAGALLAHLARQNCRCFAATHDQELTGILAALYANYHFEETVTAGGMTFDYTLHDGPTRTRNALALLRLSEYPPQIVNTADRSLDAFRETGDWTPL